MSQRLSLQEGRSMCRFCERVSFVLLLSGSGRFHKTSHRLRRDADHLPSKDGAIKHEQNRFWTTLEQPLSGDRGTWFCCERRVPRLSGMRRPLSRLCVDLPLQLFSRWRIPSTFHKLEFRCHLPGCLPPHRFNRVSDPGLRFAP